MPFSGYVITRMTGFEGLIDTKTCVTGGAVSTIGASLLHRGQQLDASMLCPLRPQQVLQA